jgi:CheY-like chemotaxis protein
MAGDLDSRRVLLVDDAADIRVVIRRVLMSRGYRVDAVATLDEARAMAPGEYDAILVDMRLGPERGTTLIAELMAADPGLASRCLLMGGSLEHVPPGVAGLAKPFLPGQLLDAVRALCGAAEPESAENAGLEEAPSAPASPAATARESAAFAAPAVTLLAMSDLLRARERAAIVDALHDGPVQDLAAAILGLHLIRERLPTAQTELLDSVARQVSQAAMSLRGLMSWYPPRWPGEPPAETIRKQTSWLLAAPPAVDIRPPPDGMSQEQGQFAASVAELALFLASGSAASDGQLPNARIRVLGTEQTLDIETTISWASGDPRDATARGGTDTAWCESLRDEMESALGADIDCSERPGEVEVRVSLHGTFGRGSA